MPVVGDVGICVCAVAPVARAGGPGQKEAQRTNTIASAPMMMTANMCSCPHCPHCPHCDLLPAAALRVVDVWSGWGWGWGWGGGVGAHIHMCSNTLPSRGARAGGRTCHIRQAARVCICAAALAAQHACAQVCRHACKRAALCVRVRGQAVCFSTSWMLATPASAED